MLHTTETGSFQHSSFTAGGVVTSAGLISVKQGLIHTLSPLSGHYRAPIDHFRTFVDVLLERGVDLHKAKIIKAELALWGVEHITKLKKMQDKSSRDGGVQRIRCVTSKVKNSMISNDHMGWKSDILYGRGLRHKNHHGGKSAQCTEPLKGNK